MLPSDGLLFPNLVKEGLPTIRLEYAGGKTLRTIFSLWRHRGRAMQQINPPQLHIVTQ
jgi:hypothetical protein